MKPNRSKNDVIWSISALNFEVKTMLSEGIGTLWIEGEISNFACPASGHWYFTLKDDRAQCRGAMFKGKNSRVGFQPKNGQHVLVRAQVTLYEARGEYQLVVDHLEDAGVGELMRRYELLKSKLANEGLFRSDLKETIPVHPRKIGIITSPGGAAIRDILSVIARRAPHIPVLIFPTLVQGDTAAQQILSALRLARANAECDVIVLTRGGGSLEDMWCFNDETLAREIASFPIPIVTGIGHEIDFTIADFVADFRAPTPSVAAETVTPDRYELMQTIDEKLSRITKHVSQQLAFDRGQLLHLQKSLNMQHPHRQFQQLRLRLQHAQSALLEKTRNRLKHRKQQLLVNQNAIVRLNPKFAINLEKQNLLRQYKQLAVTFNRNLLLKKHQLALQANSLDRLSPLKTLGRGFAIITHKQKLVNSVQQVASGDEIDISLRDGKTRATIL